MNFVSIQLIVLAVLVKLLHASMASPCSEADFKLGQWKAGSAHCGLSNDYNVSDVDSAMAPPPLVKSPYAFADWCWQPLRCDALPFSVDQFCRKLKGRLILVVGDSMQYQFYISLFMQLQASGIPQDQFAAPKLNGDATVGEICKGQGRSRIVFMRNDQMSVMRHQVTVWNQREKSPEERITNRDFKNVANLFDILVLNKGAHVLSNNVSTAMTVETARWLKTFLRQKHSRRVIYRTTPPGHPHCSASSKPDTTVLDAAPLWLPTMASSAADKDKYLHKYGWHIIPRSNEETVGLLQASLPQDQLIVMHVAEMTSLRPDGHRCGAPASGRPLPSSPTGNNRGNKLRHRVITTSSQCDELHYFMPSAVDSWTFVLFNLLY